MLQSLADLLATWRRQQRQLLDTAEGAAASDAAAAAWDGLFAANLDIRGSLDYHAWLSRCPFPVTRGYLPPDGATGQAHHTYWAWLLSVLGADHPAMQEHLPA
jgi:hypothetical protein